MHHIQENVFLAVMDITVFTLIESIPCGEKNVATRPTNRVPKPTSGVVRVKLLWRRLSSPSHIFLPLGLGCGSCRRHNMQDRRSLRNTFGWMGALQAPSSSMVESW